ncbi:unnamed protein product [Schistocephalus solidus]|uniref:Integrase_H2C2 domain-containing protein n=1 Tax=Schistocephalus solidus TaxID=70667 RepID=A0A183SVC9_SCHSO|nr:unnamed protein product [Schistocephalus solidus]
MAFTLFSDTQHVNNKENVVADALSRIKINKITTQPIEYTLMVATQRSDEEHPEFFPLHILRFFQDFFLPTQAGTITCYFSSGHKRPFVPKTLRQYVFTVFHGPSHPGIRATVKLITVGFVYRNINLQWSKFNRHSVFRPTTQCQERSSRNAASGFTGISTDLDTLEFVLDRYRTSCRPLPLSCGGQCKVVWRSDTEFVINRNGKSETISIDLIKPAFFEDAEPTSPKPSAQSQILPSLPPASDDQPLVMNAPVAASNRYTSFTCYFPKLDSSQRQHPGNYHHQWAKPGEGLWCFVCLQTGKSGEQPDGTENGVSRSGTGVPQGRYCCSQRDRFSEQSQLEELGAGYTFWSGRPKAERRNASVAFAIRKDIVRRLICLPHLNGTSFEIGFKFQVLRALEFLVPTSV